MHLDRLPSRGMGALIEKFRLLERREGEGYGPLALGADCHFAIGFMLSDEGCQTFVGGPSTGPYVACPSPGAEYFFVRFRPGKMPRLLDAAPTDLVDAAVRRVPRLLGMDTDQLGERLRAARTLAAKQEILEALLWPAQERPLCQDRRCVAALDMIDALGGRVQVAEVARELGLSLRTLHRMFQDQVGLSPKRLIRHLRVQRAMEQLQRGPAEVSLSRLACAHGFADQSHMIREFRSLIGRLPSEFPRGAVAERP